MEVIKEKDMKLLSRKRATVLIKGTAGTPGRKNLVKDLAKKFNTKEDNIIIKHMYPQFGSRDTKIIVHIYEDPAKMSKFEHGSLLKKHHDEVKKDADGKPEETKAESKSE